MTAGNGLWLHITRVVPATRDEVWRVMTDPAELAKWWGPKGFTVPSVDFAPEVGESFRIDMQPPEGEPFHLSGRFRAVDPPSHLSYTFVWDPPDPDDRETLVMLSFRDLGDRTEIRLTQGEFATEERLALHEGGWGDSFEKLEALFG